MHACIFQWTVLSSDRRSIIANPNPIRNPNPNPSQSEPRPINFSLNFLLNFRSPI